MAEITEKLRVHLDEYLWPRFLQQPLRTAQCGDFRSFDIQFDKSRFDVVEKIVDITLAQMKGDTKFLADLADCIINRLAHCDDEQRKKQIFQVVRPLFEQEYFEIFKQKALMLDQPF